MWIPLMDYAIKKSVSLSTLRRHIKAGKIQYKIEQGKYFLYCGVGADSSANDRNESFTEETQSAYVSKASDDSAPRELKLREELRLAQEEIAELKMLIAIYEENLAGASQPHPHT